MDEKEKIYHIYLRNKCIFFNLSRDQFKHIWESYKRLLKIDPRPFEDSDLTYEEIPFDKTDLYTYYSTGNI
jgi:hypothetical protein